jgi:hypothetical protein
MSRTVPGVLRLCWMAGPRMLGLLTRLGILAAGLKWHRRRAVASFRQALLDSGVPAEAAAELARDYPDVAGAFRGL